MNDTSPAQIESNKDRLAASAPAQALGALFVIAVTFLVYLPALRAGFVWDDDEHFSANPLMTGPGGLWRIWTEQNQYYPLTSTSFWLIARLRGIEPFAYHLPGVIFHALNSILLWGILRRLGMPWPWLCGLIFAVHPVHVQSVAWATELKNTQSGFFYLLSLHSFVSFSRSGRNTSYGGSLGFFLLALLSKTSTVTLPFAVALIHFWRGGPLNRSAITRLAPYFAMSAAMGLLTVLLHREQVSGLRDWDETFGQRCLLAARCFWSYFGKLAWPAPLTFVYPRWEPGFGRLLWIIPPAGLGLALAAIIMTANAAARRSMIFGIVYFAASLLPVLNFFRMYYTRYAYTADHWQYLADMGAIPLAVALAAAVWTRPGSVAAEGWRRPLAAGGLGVMCLLLCALTFRQSRAYLDTETLWFDTLRKNPRAGVAYSNLGTIYIERGDFGAAVEILSRGESAVPENLAIQNNLALAALGQNRYEDAVRISRGVLARNPGEATAFNNLAAALYHMGRVEEAVRSLREGLARDPENEMLRENLAQLEGRTLPAR